MAIKSGETTYHQAKRGIVQNGLVLNLDAAVDASYDGGTTWRDLEGDNNGTLTNGPTFDKTNGGSIVFDGSDDYIQSSVLTSLVTGNGTFNIWLKWTAEVFAMFHIKSGYGGGNYTNGEYWGVYANHAVGTYLRFHSGAGYGTSNINLGLTSGDWCNITITYNGSGGSGKVYANGSFISNASWTAFNTPDGDIRFGSGGYASVNYSGQYGLINMYDRELSAAEVLQNYNATRHRFGV